MKVTRNKNKKTNPYKVKKICKGWSNYGMLGKK